MTRAHDTEDIVGPFCCRERLRESHRPGCLTHPIPALRSAQQGPWRRGVVLSTDEFEVRVGFTESEESTVLATLWMDRFNREVRGPIERDGFGRAIVQWSPPWRVIKLIGPHGSPLFDVAEAGRYPDAVTHWRTIPRTCRPGRHRRL